MNMKLPDCPKCGAGSTAPARAGMGMPYVCPACSTSFSLVIPMTDISQLREAYKDTPPDEFIANTHCRIIFPTDKPGGRNGSN